MDTPGLDALHQKANTELRVDTEKKFVEVETVLTILIYHGLRLLLPELKEWVKLGLSKIALKRAEIEKRLQEYALEQELDYDTAEKASRNIARNINEDNIQTILHELEQSQ